MNVRPLLFALPILLVLTGCATTAAQSALQQKVGASGMPASELRVRVRERLPRYVGALERFGDQVNEEASSLAAQAEISRFEIDAIPQIQLALFRPDPLAAVVDGWALVLQMKDSLHRLADEGRLSERQRALGDRMLTDMEGDLEGLWAEAIGRTDISRARAYVRGWAKAHPLDAIGTRASTVELLAGVTAASGGKSLVATAGAVLETSQDLVDRMDALTALMPREARWQVEYLLQRNLQPMSRESARSAVDAGLDTLTTPENLRRLQSLVRSAVDAALRSSLGTPTSVPVPPRGVPSADRTRVLPVLWRQPIPDATALANLAAAAAAPRPEAPAVQLARETGQAAARALSQELVRQLGAEGRGPLGVAVSDTAARMTAAAIQGARDELQGSAFPQCQGPERSQCIEQNLARLSGTFAAGATRGVKSELSLLPVALGFLAGVAAVLLVWLGWALRGSSAGGLRHRAGV